MDPQLKSILTSVLLGISTGVAGWAANRGLIPNGDQSVIANDLVTAVSGGIAAVLAWYKTRQVSQPAMIQAVNAADNGVKVVASTSTAPIVTAPLKGPTT